MSKRLIMVLICHRHKLLDPIYYLLVNQKWKESYIMVNAHNAGLTSNMNVWYSNKNMLYKLYLHVIQ
jgi:hypothetical protein